MGSAYHIMRIWTRYLDPDSERQSKKAISSYTSYRQIYNPLQNLLILNKVFDFLDTSSVLRMRCVCSSWNSEICRRLNKLQPPTYLKFQQDSDLRELNKLSRNVEKVPFFIHNFYFKMARFTPQLSRTLSYHHVQDLITNLKVVVHTNDFAILLLHLKKLKQLRHFSLIRLPSLDLSLEQNTMVEEYRTRNEYGVILQNLETLQLRNLCCGKEFFCRYNTCTTSLISFLKCAHNLKVLEFSLWPGKIINIIEKSKVHKTLVVLRIRGKTLGDDDVKRLSCIGFPHLTRVMLTLDKNVTKDVISNFLKSLPKNAMVDINVK